MQRRGPGGGGGGCVGGLGVSARHRKTVLFHCKCQTRIVQLVWAHSNLQHEDPNKGDHHQRAKHMHAHAADSVQ